MRFKDVFSIIGPVMVGPSSSHTAGAVRIGRVARQLIDGVPEEAEITLFGSFAETYAGHGTDLALVGGLLNFGTDDERIPTAFDEAKKAGMTFTLRKGTGARPHPNYAEIKVIRGNRTITIGGASIGGGNIEIHSVNGFDAGFTGHYPTIVIAHADQVGVIASITNAIRDAGLNIGHMRVDRVERSGSAMTVLECDRLPERDLLQSLTGLPSVEQVYFIDLNTKG
ncbi:L-serine ammonia-lyase, iron-sulfur-dependent subunit beta [Paenibacillus qinlingensis]|uniref:L-serine deaminase n=1 Tax=Paenibacillus qinlingensis TaxID=1837343 RepID=A0ABU1NVG3_9BACL|nr:L-serine ammonia-lyase, iron-sulfur-dependent subunit beta [Paenibacillus qinlingensis]MDR6550982.1 L-serine dehydratase [Paenibacillus qinlingensis]